MTSFYDPMIAKLVVFGENRRTALKRLKNSLAHYEVCYLTMRHVVSLVTFENRIFTGCWCHDQYSISHETGWSQ